MLITGNLNAFTAVTSGAWSNPATWGGIAPGSTVFNQDIIIPAGINVDLDVDVDFTGLLNQFGVSGTLMTTSNRSLQMNAGTFTGAGTVDIHRLNIAAITTVYSYTGMLVTQVFRAAGGAVPLGGVTMVYDTLDLEQGSMVIASGSDLQLMGNSTVRVNNGTLTNGGGLFTTVALYDVWYFGATKVSGEELNSVFVGDLHVSLTNNTQILTLSALTTVNGLMEMTSGIVALNAQRLRLLGDLNRSAGALFQSAGLSDLVMAGTQQLTSTLEFTPGSTLDELIINNDTHAVHLENELTVTGTLMLEQGWFVIDVNGDFTIGTGAWITRIMGQMANQGTFDATQMYNVGYMGDSLWTGIELSGSGLNDLVVYTWLNNSRINLTQDVTVPGNFILSKGWFNLDTFDIEFTGGFHQESDSRFLSTSLSNVTFSQISALGDTLWIGQTSPSFHDLTIDIPSDEYITFMSYNASVHHYLNMVSGRIYLTNWDLTLGTNAVYMNATDSTYIITENTGGLRWFNPVNSIPVEYPIGTMDDYAPVEISNHTPALPGFITVRVKDGVYTNGETGTDVSTTQSVVNKTWVVEPDTAMLLNMDMMLLWTVASEVNGFDRNFSYIKNYDTATSMWDSYMLGQAMPDSFSTYGIMRMGITSAGGAFAVVDSLSPLSTPEHPITVINVYPNPTTDFVYTEVPVNSADMFTYEVFDASGRLVNSFSNAEARNQIDFRSFELGSYTIRITNVITNEVVNKPIIKS